MQPIFSVFDSKAEAFTAPFVAKTRGLAVRMFEELVNQEGHQFCKFPEDYTLFVIGNWDEVKGEVKAQTPESLGVAIGYTRGGEIEAMA